MTELLIADHPLLAVRGFATQLARPLSELSTPEDVRQLLSLDAAAPLAADDRLRTAIRDMLRRGGFKPTGRSKPASEYLRKAAGELALSSINFVVDICNAVSLHSGLPISVVDKQLVVPPLRIAIAEPGSSYVFNASGQVIDVGGLVCLHDLSGPCANAVKDAQRAKTRAETTETVSVIWGATQVVRQLDDAVRWYRELLERHGAATTDIVVSTRG